MKIIVFVLLFCMGRLCAQDLMQYDPVPDSLLVKTTAGKRISYSCQDYTIDIYGRNFKVKEGKKILFGDTGEQEAKMVVPHIYFLKADSTYHKLLVAEYSSGFSLGLGIYIINGTESRKIGFLALADDDTAGGDKENLYPVSAVKDLMLQTDGDNLFISFKCNKIIIHPGSDREELVDANEIKFIYNGKKLKEVKKF